MKKVTIILVLVFSMFMFSNSVLAKEGIEGNTSSLVLIEDSNVKDVFKICDKSSKTLGAFKLGGIFITLAKIIVPVIIIVMGMLDVSKAVSEGKDDSIKKSFINFLKRAIAAILVFFIPSIILAIFTFVDGFDNVNSAYKNCIDCLLKPSECQGTLTAS